MSEKRSPIDAGSRGFANPLDGSLYPYTPATREAAYKACQASIDATIERRSKFANKTLTDKEVFRGVKHEDTRDDTARSAWRLSHQFVAAKSETSAPDIHPMDDPRFQVAGSRSETLDEFRARSKREFDARHATPKAEHPSRTRAKEAAARALERVKYDPTVPQHLVDHAQLLVEMANAGDLQVYKKYHAEFIDGVLALDAEKQMTLAGQIERLKAQALSHYELDDPKTDPPKREPKPKTEAPPYYPPSYSLISEEEKAKRNEEFFAWKAAREQASDQ